VNAVHLLQAGIIWSIHNHSQTALSSSTTHSTLSVFDALDQPLPSSPWTSIHQWWISMWKTRFCLRKLDHITNFFTGWSLSHCYHFCITLSPG